MRRLLDLLATASGTAEDATTEQRLFQALALASGLVALGVVVPTNLAQGLPVLISSCTLIFGLGALAIFAAARRGRYYMKLLVFMHLANLDLIWFSNAGSEGSIAFYFFSAALYLVIFFKGTTRWLLLGGYLLNGLGLFWLEYLRPEWIWHFPSPASKYLDLSVGYVLSSAMCIFIVWVVFDAYHRERESLARSLEALGTSEARFRSLVMDAPVPIAMVSRRGAVVYVNRAFQEVLGYSQADIPDLEAWWAHAYPDPDQRAKVATQWLRDSGPALAEGRSVPPVEYTVTRKDGSLAHVEIQGALIGDRWLVMFSDVTDRRRGEEAVRQAQKLESLGILAGGIAHDFNNLLSAMLGNLNLAQLKLPVGAASAPYLDNMEATIQKAVDLTRQMLAYSGRGRFVVEPLDLNRLVSEITHLLAVSISKKIRLSYDLAPQLPPVEGEAAQIQQVLMNLVTNASEAIGEAEGVITVSTGIREIPTATTVRDAAGQALATGRYVVLAISDTGCGIPPELRLRIFDPFFSTKGSGRGLGLSAMLGILRGHRGGIDIQSEPGQGSTFLIHFPASEASLPDRRVAATTEGEATFQGKVLLVDDEAQLRFSFGSMLQHLGFQVVAARDGVEALERFRPREFALVFMDLTMPRMDGREAFLQMKARDPEVRVILTSGYSEGEAVESQVGLNPAGFIQKPFDLAELTRVLGRVLG